MPDDGHYQGWIYKPGNLLEIGQDFQNDYIILDKPEQESSASDNFVLPAPPYCQCSSTECSLNLPSVPKQRVPIAVSTPEINSSNFRVSQNFSSRSVLLVARRCESGV